MKSLQDALYNWLTIKVVVDARPDDTAAIETEIMFHNILTKDHGVEVKGIRKDEVMYFIDFSQESEDKTVRFPIELIDVMLNQIQLDPEKYKNYN
ncbi:hypothetical protein [Peribacillus alkalitolerans]|uniref:hypothetical protein n=1 Tax=Peribacillus alkalitolerans TaxID=1550385 RepID=UPI0013CFBADE|nr:hypothetical protein [Peribacillus alkalitolerans]